MKYKLIVIGIDQSYTRTGITIAGDNKLLKVTSTNYKGLKSKSQKRKHINSIIRKLLIQTQSRAHQTIIICERIRTFSQSFGTKGKGNQQGLNPNYLKMGGAMVAGMVDTAEDFEVPVYSVDTRAWKSKIVGSSKARKTKEGKRDAKSETVEFIQRLGIDLFLRTNRNGVDVFDDDAADSACIALYGFIPKKLQNLKQEE